MSYVATFVNQIFVLFIAVSFSITDCEPIRFANRHVRNTVIYGDLDAKYWNNNNDIHMPFELLQKWFTQIVVEVEKPPTGRLNSSQRNNLYELFLAVLSAELEIYRMDNDTGVLNLYWPGEFSKPTAKVIHFNNMYRKASTECEKAAIIEAIKDTRTNDWRTWSDYSASSALGIGIAVAPPTQYCYLKQWIQGGSGQGAYNLGRDLPPPDIPTESINNYIKEFDVSEAKKYVYFSENENQFKPNASSLVRFNLQHVRTMVTYGMIS